MQLVLARDGTVDRPATDVVAPDQLPMLEALQTRLEGKTAKQKNPHPKLSIDGARVDHPSAPPVLGAHTAEVLAEAGFSQDDVDRLATDGIVSLG